MSERISTGDVLLDQAMIEFRRMGNIDVFNNMVTFACHPNIWHEIGHPQEITDEIYRKSPLAAVFKKLVKDGQEL